jgi:PAS domain S-box-containing protein
MILQENRKPHLNRAPRKQISNADGVVLTDAPEFACQFLPDFTITYVNQACCRYFGVRQEDLIGQSFMALISKENQPIVSQYLLELNPEDPVLAFEQRTLNPSAEIRWQEWIIQAVFHDLENMANFHAIGRDITMFKTPDKNIEHTERQYRAVVEDQMELVCRYRPDFKLTFVNQAYCRYHGKKPNELIGQRFLPYVRPEVKREVLEFIKSATPDHPVVTTHQRITNKNGEPIWVEWCRRALFDDAGNLYAIQGVGRDITEFKKADAALRSSKEALHKKNAELEHKNAALNELLEQIEIQKKRIKDDVIANTEDLLIPILQQLISQGSKVDNRYLILIKRSLENLTSSFGRKITQRSLRLTPREINICNMVKRDLSSKEIAALLNISLNTVGRHRHSIRKKLNIANTNVNLNTFLKNW